MPRLERPSTPDLGRVAALARAQVALCQLEAMRNMALAAADAARVKTGVSCSSRVALGARHARARRVSGAASASRGMRDVTARARRATGRGRVVVGELSVAAGAGLGWVRARIVWIVAALARGVRLHTRRGQRGRLRPMTVGAAHDLGLPEGVGGVAARAALVATGKQGARGDDGLGRRVAIDAAALAVGGGSVQPFVADATARVERWRGSGPGRHRPGCGVALGAAVHELHGMAAAAVRRRSWRVTVRCVTRRASGASVRRDGGRAAPVVAVPVVTPTAAPRPVLVPAIGRQAARRVQRGRAERMAIGAVGLSGGAEGRLRALARVLDARLPGMTGGAGRRSWIVEPPGGNGVALLAGEPLARDVNGVAPREPRLLPLLRHVRGRAVWLRASAAKTREHPRHDAGHHQHRR